LDPLYDKFQRWKSGELSHDDMGEAIHQTHKQTRELYSLFMEKRTWLVRLAQFDAEWFDAWVKAHPPPVGAHRVSRPEIVSSSDEEEQAE
jgi:hypothetical protein